MKAKRGLQPKITFASSWLLHIAAVINWEAFRNCQLRGNFVIVELRIADKPLFDPIGRQAIARTAVIGREFHISIRGGLSDEEGSVTLYHEVLEAVTVASDNLPPSVSMFNEGDFEQAAYRAYAELGEASPATMDRMLQSHGF